MILAALCLVAPLTNDFVELAKNYADKLAAANLIAPLSGKSFTEPEAALNDLGRVTNGTITFRFDPGSGQVPEFRVSNRQEIDLVPRQYEKVTKIARKEYGLLGFKPEVSFERLDLGQPMLGKLRYGGVPVDAEQQPEISVNPIQANLNISKLALCLSYPKSFVKAILPPNFALLLLSPGKRSKVPRQKLSKFNHFNFRFQRVKRRY